MIDQRRGLGVRDDEEQEIVAGRDSQIDDLEGRPGRQRAHAEIVADDDPRESQILPQHADGLWRQRRRQIVPARDGQMTQHHHRHARFDRDPERQRVFFPPGGGIDVEDRQCLVGIDGDAAMPRKMLDAVQDAGPLHPGKIRRDVLGHDLWIISESSPGHETVRAECHIRDRREVDVEPVAASLSARARASAEISVAGS